MEAGGWRGGGEIIFLCGFQEARAIGLLGLRIDRFVDLSVVPRVEMWRRRELRIMEILGAVEGVYK